MLHHGDMGISRQRGHGSKLTADDVSLRGGPKKGDGEMPKYVMLTRLTDEGAQTIKRNPERIKEVDSELSSMGVSVLEQYAVLGPYDFVNIVEAPDNLTVAKAALDLGARGSIRIQTLPAIPVDEFIAGLK